MPSDDDETESKPLAERADIDHAFDSRDTVNTGTGGQLASKLASLSSSPQDFTAPTETDVEALPAGAREISIREAIRDGQASVELEHVRDLMMPDVHSLETLRQGSVPSVDVNATIVTKQDAEPAQLLRDRALDVRRDMDQLETIRRPSGSDAPHAVDVNATIVTQRARTAAEQERDIAFEKLRDGTADELRKPRRSTTEGLPLLVTKAETRGARSRPDDDSGITTHAAGNEMRGTINRRSHDDGPDLDPSEQAIVGRLRALLPEGNEPDWNALEASIRSEVRDQPMYRPWWQRWQYLVPLGALAATAGLALVVMKTNDAQRQASLTVPRDAGTSERGEPSIREPAPTLWLDGEPVELDEISPAALDEVVPDPEIYEEGDDASDAASDGILPVIDDGWIDTLDADGVARAESWLARERS